MLKKIPYITLWSKNFDASINFYKDILGLSVEYQDENFVQFQTEGTKLYIHRIKDGEELLRKHTVEIHFEVTDVDEVFDELRSKGIEFDGRPENMPWGTRQASFRDPEGYAIELVGPLKPGATTEGE